MATSRGTRFPRGRSRRQTEWEEGPFGILNFTAAGSSAIPTSQQAVQSGLTLVRLRGELLVQMSSATAQLDGFPQAAAGVCIVSENAAGVGATAIPGLLTDIEWNGWLWHQSFTIRRAGSGLTDDAAIFRFPVDSKAMRRFKSLDILVAMVEMGTETGTAVVDVSFNSRILLKIA